MPYLKAKRTAIILSLSICAGGGDLVTGLLLIFAPKATLDLMQVPVPGELTFLRFVGCFVGTVGLSYFIGLASWPSDGGARLRAAWELTIFFRLAAAFFVAAQVFSGNLAWQWLSVPSVDTFWFLLQGVLLSLGIFDNRRNENLDR